MFYYLTNFFAFESEIQLTGFNKSISVPSDLQKVHITFKNSEHYFEEAFTENSISLHDKRNNVYVIKNDEIRVHFANLDIDWISMYIFSLPIGYLNFLNGFHIMHGSSFSYKNQAISLIGKSGSGKSSICSLLLSKNFKFISEDLTILDENLNAYFFNNYIKLSETFYDLSSEYMTKTTNLSMDSRDRSLYKIAHKFCNFNPTKIRKCYFLEWSDHQEIIDIDNESLFKYLLTFSYGTLDEKNVLKRFDQRMKYLNKMMADIKFYVFKQKKCINEINRNIDKLSKHALG